MAYDRRALTGVGGWLAFFVVTLAISALAAAVVSVGALVYADGAGAAPTLRRYVEVVAAVGVVGAVGYGYLAWRLCARLEPATPRVVIGGLWLLAIGIPAADMLAAATLFGSGAAADALLLDKGTIRTLVHAAIWTAYLLRSERVANTYAPADDALATVFR